ncbi:uncharacterized protein CTRU02_210852 [Colletotrichum truncatum]|uniref:Uncharacterized protein n=1 Tax=Colletotrichum truncatum TaxID=5467 RepID=A0ACC3YQ64_COLTU
MTTTPRRIIDKASVQVRVGSTSGDSGYDSGPDQRVLVIQALKREDFWLNDTRDKPVALHDESETSDDIKASRIAIAKGEILRFNNAVRPFHEREPKDLQWTLKLPSFSPKLLQTETAQKLKGGASNDTEKIPSEPTTEKNTQRTNAPSTPLFLSTIFSSREEQPAYVKAFIHLIQKLPDEKKHLLQHGCPCKITHNQVSHDNVHEEGYDVLYTEEEDEKDAIEDATYVADEKDTAAVEGESSNHAVPRNRSAVTKRSPKTGRAAGKKPSPPKHGRKIGKSGDDGDEDDGEDDPIRVHNIPRNSNTWLCPFFILWFIEIFCPNIVLHTPPPPLRQCCRPPTAIKNFSGLRYHLRRDHGAEIDETILNNIMNAKFTGVDFQRYQQIWAALFPDVAFPEFFSSHCKPTFALNYMTSNFALTSKTS